MAQLRSFCFLMLFSTSLYAQEQLIDSRDGKAYKIVTIGNQTWMAENLSFHKELSRAIEPGKLNGNGPTEYYFCPMDKDENCEKLGILYTFESAQNACPVDWHLPSQEEFKLLLSNIGGRRKDVYTALTQGGVNAQFGGALFHYNSTLPEFVAVADKGFYWTSTSSGGASGESRRLEYFAFLSKMKMIFNYKDHGMTAFSVWCVKNGTVK